MIKMPRLNGFIGGECFDFEDGTSSKIFYRAGKFDESIGSYPILNEKNEIVEYMDVIGNFSKQPTELAKYFYRYISAEKCAYMYYNFNIKQPYSAIVDFPSRLLVDDKVFEIIKKEEKEKYKSYEFKSVFDKLNYKFYINTCLKNKKAKVKKLKNLLKQKEEDLKQSKENFQEI